MFYNDILTDSYYSSFLNSAKTLWDSFTPAINDLEYKYILVDLMVEFEPYLLGNLFIAKYLQKRENVKIAGIMRDSNALERWKNLLSTFGIQEVFFCNSDIDFDKNKYSEFIDCLKDEKDIKKVRNNILQFNINGLVVGDILYDSYLRDTGSSTINYIDDKLINYIFQTIKYYEVYQRIFNNKSIVATILGHTVYNMYGMLAKVSIKNNVVVFGRKPGSSPLTIRQYFTPDDLKEHDRGINKDTFEYIYLNHKHKAIDFGINYFKNRHKGQMTSNTLQYLPGGYGNDKIKYDIHELSTLLGIDPDKPTVFLMSHILPDSVHCDRGMLHNDYFEWLEDTLEIVSHIKHVNWVVKSHPENKHYQVKGDVISELTNTYSNKHPHIVLAPENIKTSCIHDIAHAIVTVRGTAAIEFSANGIPSITTGINSTYSSLGFTIEPKSRDEYIVILSNIDRLQKLDQEKIDRALTCCYCYNYLSLVDCVFVPNVSNVWWVQFDLKSFWENASSAINNNTIEMDPLYQNFNILCDNKLTHLMKYDELHSRLEIGEKEVQVDDVFLLIGQSNMEGMGNLDEVEMISHDNVFMLRNGKWIVAEEPIHNMRSNITTKSGIGLGMSFAMEIAKNNPNKKIGLVPCDSGGSFLDKWERGSDLYNYALRMTKIAMKTGTLKGILWLQGEGDCTKEEWAKSYYQRFVGFIAAFKNDLGISSTPILIGQLGDFLNNHQNYKFLSIVNKALKLASQSIPKCGYVSSTGLSDKGDSIHFNSNSLRTLGIRYAEEYFRITSNNTYQ
ncbi:MAG: sialate O-acetylesterase [Desulfobacterales bacterium]|nr:sialate O-acetylesterase [Desulfobacterales bacterium]